MTAHRSLSFQEQDDSEIDEGLRTLRNERRTELHRKKPIHTEEITLGAAVDRGFEEIGRNKATRYVGRLGEDKNYIDSSDLDNEDSKNESDPEVVSGVDLPGRRKSEKVLIKKQSITELPHTGSRFRHWTWIDCDVTYAKGSSTNHT